MIFKGINVNNVWVIDWRKNNNVLKYMCIRRNTRKGVIVKRYKLTISYDGTNYSGFQIQPDKVTVQGVLENAMSKAIGESITIVPSGRTDAGVSAIGQVAHFDVEDIDERRTMGFVNSLLPSDIRVLDIEETTKDFHARFGAKRKTYEYLFYVGHSEIPVYERLATHVGYNVNIEDMKMACKYFVGTHDYSAFCASNTSVVDKVRTIYDMHIDAISDGLYRLSITGNGFLYNMVRIIMGTLISVGMGKIKVEDIPKVIDGLDRSQAGKTMPSKGLYLKKVEY